MALAPAFLQRNAGCRATHLREKAHEAHDGLELARLENAAAGHKSHGMAAILSYSARHPDAIPCVVTPLGGLGADQFQHIPTRQKTKQHFLGHNIGPHIARRYHPGPFHVPYTTSLRRGLGHLAGRNNTNDGDWP